MGCVQGTARGGHRGQVPAISSEERENSRVAQQALILRETNLIDEASRAAIYRCRTFMYREIQAATRHYNSTNPLGIGGFGIVYKGRLLESNQDVAIKYHDPNSHQGIKEFVSEVSTLCRACHPNIVKMIGYCAEGDQRILVYEFMALGSLESHLFDLPPNRSPLDWNTRMRIASGVANGLRFLHEEMNPPVIYRDLKTANILLDERYCPKLSDFGLARSAPNSGGQAQMTLSMTMGTEGYVAPEYVLMGLISFKIDIYCFGVVLLELITGRIALDQTRAKPEQNLAGWARDLLGDRRNFPNMVDPLLAGCYPEQELNKALELARECVDKRYSKRPTAGKLATNMSCLGSPPSVPSTSSQS